MIHSDPVTLALTLALDIDTGLVARVQRKASQPHLMVYNLLRIKSSTQEHSCARNWKQRRCGVRKGETGCFTKRRKPGKCQNGRNT